MSWRLTILCAGLGLGGLGGLGGVAWANPIATSLTRALQVPGTRHVQLTVATLRAAAGEPTVTRDGAALAGPWVRARRFVTEGGSGPLRYSAVQRCDCGLEPGLHLYKLRLRAGDTPHEQSVWIKDWRLEGKPRRLQGLDCTATCPAAPASAPVAAAPRGETASAPAGGPASAPAARPTRAAAPASTRSAAAPARDQDQPQLARGAAVEPAAEHHSADTRRRRWMLAGLTVLLLVAGALAILLIARRGAPR